MLFNLFMERGRKFRHFDCTRVYHFRSGRKARPCLRALYGNNELNKPGFSNNFDNPDGFCDELIKLYKEKAQVFFNSYRAKKVMLYLVVLQKRLIGRKFLFLPDQWMVVNWASMAGLHRQDIFELSAICKSTKQVKILNISFA